MKNKEIKNENQIVLVEEEVKVERERKSFFKSPVKIGIASLLLFTVIGGTVFAVDEFLDEDGRVGHKIEKRVNTIKDSISGATSKKNNKGEKISTSIDEEKLAKVKVVIAKDLNSDVNQLKFSKIKMDRTDDYGYDKDGDRKEIIEVEVYKEHMEYEYELDANSLEILKGEID